MTNSESPGRISRRTMFGIGAATAGVVATGGGKAAFAEPIDDRSSPPSNPPDDGFGDAGSFANAITRVPGTDLLILNAGNFAANLSTIALPTLDGVYPSTLGFVEAKIPVPSGSTIRRIDVYGRRGSSGTQAWKVQRYDPTNFGAANASALYLTTLTGNGNLTGTMGIPAEGLPVPDGLVYAVYLSDSDATSTAWGVAVQYTPPARGYRPIDPARVYDSRAAAPTPGVLARNQSRVVSIKDGRDAAGTVVAADVAPGDAASVSTSTLNWPGGFDIANGSSVKLDGSRQVKVFMGDQGGSSHFIIDITGYYI
jgi:hypothetical protein